MKTPSVGVGVIIFNQTGKILLGHRCGSHAPFWALPGGSMEIGESFEQAAIRETYEETGISLASCELIGLTNNLETYQSEGIHYVATILLSGPVNQTPKCCEPNRCSKWQWFSPSQLPSPLFEGSRQAIHNWLTQKFYTSNQDNC